MKRASRGYTLFELMMALTIVGILLGISVPTFREFSRNNSVTAAQNELVTAFNVARSEALRRNRPVSVCASANGTTCGAETEWGSGWMAFTDRGTPGTLDGDDVALQAWQSPNTNLVFAAGGSTFVQYLPSGMTAAAIAIDVSYTGCTGLRTRHVAVTATGAIAGQLISCT